MSFRLILRIGLVPSGSVELTSTIGFCKLKEVGIEITC